MEPLLAFGGPLLASTPGYGYELRRNEACVVVGSVVVGMESTVPDVRFVVCLSSGRLITVRSLDIDIANPAGPSWTPEWIADMTALRAATAVR